MCMKVSVQQEVKQKIMSTDVYVNVISQKHTQDEVEKDVEKCFEMFREFEERFSRFQEGNELSVFNADEGEVEVSQDFLKMLKAARVYYTKTNGIFDISILPVLKQEGYTKSKTQGFGGGEIEVDNIEMRDMSTLVIYEDYRGVVKPRGLQCDLGGIGKGYIVDKVTRFLSQKYVHFLVDAGGDMYAKGKDVDNKYNSWAIGIDNAVRETSEEKIYVSISDKAVATSGIRERSWKKEGIKKHHIIDPRTQKSLENDLASVTVIASTTVEADVLAKTLLILGKKAGEEYAHKNSIPAIYIQKDSKVFINTYAQPYVWN